MKKIVILIFGLLLLAAACQKVVLQHEVPSSPKESYDQLPR